MVVASEDGCSRDVEVNVVDKGGPYGHQFIRL